jgi:hypothetical protein
MSDHIEPDFADAIYEFACKLPQTIRPDILAFVVVYATGKFNEGDDVLLRLKTFLSPRMSGLSRFGATLCTIAALDYVLQRAASTTRQCRPMLHALAEQIPELDAVVLGHPFRERHFSQALDDWKKIRRDLITPQTLEDFEDRCLRPPILRSGTSTK